MGKEDGCKYGSPCGPLPAEGQDKRSGLDRRTNRREGLKYLLFNGRRERIRREEDRRRVFFFDRYNPKLLAAITTILLLSVFDALLTLLLIEHGSSELNPVMSYFLKYGPLPFVIAKYGMTSFGVFVLLIFKNVFFSGTRVRTHSFFSWAIIAFGTVIAWEIFLVFLTH